MRVDDIHALFKAKQLQHPELARPLTWRGLQRIVAREGVGLHLRDIDEPAQLVGFLGTYAIIVNANEPPARHTSWAAHELAHLWLHVDRADGRAAIVFNYGDQLGPDDREQDAEYLATLLMQPAWFRRHFVHVGRA